MQCRLKVTLPVVSVQKPKRLSLSPYRRIRCVEYRMKNEYSSAYLTFTRASTEVWAYLEGPWYSDVAVVFKLWRTSDKEAPQCGDCPRLKGSPRVARYGLFPWHTHHVECEKMRPKTWWNGDLQKLGMLGFVGKCVIRAAFKCLTTKLSSTSTHIWDFWVTLLSTLYVFVFSDINKMMPHF